MIFLETEASSIAERLKRIEEEGKKIYIYGAGVYGRIFADFFDEENIKWYGFIDADSHKAGTVMRSKKIYSFEHIKSHINEMILVMSMITPVDERELDKIYENLMSLGLKDEQIIQVYKTPIWFTCITYKVRKPENILRKWDNIKDIYKGRRAFLVGNGPSLTLNDIKKMKNDLFFGCNGLFEMCNLADVYPTGFYFQDGNFFKFYSADVNLLDFLSERIPLLFSTIVNELTKDKVNIYNNLYLTYHNYKGEKFFSDDPREGCCRWGTSVMVLLQIMLFLGIEEIYLVGMDFSFFRELTSKGIVINDNVFTHPKEISIPNESGMYDVQLIYEGWCQAKKMAEERHIIIKNATRGGKLEVFPRVDFDSLFEN